ncbi:MAG: FixH family protein [Oceanicaulis sp.]
MSTGDWNDVHEGPAKFRIKGWHVLAMMVAFFGVIFTVNTLFITLALGSFPGEQTRRSYMQGLQYNDVIAEREAQAALGWTAAANLTAETVIVSVRDANANPVTNLQLEGALRRPADMDLDHALAFEEIRPGVYSAPVSGLLEGRYILEAQSAGELPFVLESELWRR